jgi:hypothetical protein
MRAIGATGNPRGPRNWAKCHLLFWHTPPRASADFPLKTVKVPLQIKICDQVIIQEEYWTPKIVPLCKTNSCTHFTQTTAIHCIMYCFPPPLIVVLLQTLLCEGA